MKEIELRLIELLRNKLIFFNVIIVLKISLNLTTFKNILINVNKSNNKTKLTKNILINLKR